MFKVQFDEKAGLYMELTSVEKHLNSFKAQILDSVYFSGVKPCGVKSNCCSLTELHHFEAREEKKVTNRTKCCCCFCSDHRVQNVTEVRLKVCPIKSFLSEVLLVPWSSPCFFDPEKFRSRRKKEVSGGRIV